MYIRLLYKGGKNFVYCIMVLVIGRTGKLEVVMQYRRQSE